MNNAFHIWELDAPGDGTDQLPFTTLTGQRNFVFGLAFSSDGRYLATSDVERVHIWSLNVDARTAELLATLTGHTGTVYGINFSSDGQILVTAAPFSFDPIWLWDLSGLTSVNGAETVSELLKLGPGSATAFSVDGSQLISADRNGLIRVTLLDPDEPVALANGRLTCWWTTEECQQFLHEEACPIVE